MGEIIDFRPKQQPAAEPVAEVVQDIWSCVSCHSVSFNLWVNGDVYCAGCHRLCHRLQTRAKTPEEA